MSHSSVTYTWIGEGTKKGNRVYYDGLSVQSPSITIRVHIGTVVLLESPPGQQSFVARISGLYETPKGAKMMINQWFYRFEDIDASSRLDGLMCHEVVLCNDHNNLNPVESILALAQVVALRPSTSLSVELAVPQRSKKPSKAGDWEVLICRFMFESAQRHTRPIALDMVHSDQQAFVDPQGIAWSSKRKYQLGDKSAAASSEAHASSASSTAASAPASKADDTSRNTSSKHKGFPELGGAAAAAPSSRPSLSTSVAAEDVTSRSFQNGHTTGTSRAVSASSLHNVVSQRSPMPARLDAPPGYRVPSGASSLALPSSSSSSSSASAAAAAVAAGTASSLGTRPHDDLAGAAASSSSTSGRTFPNLPLQDSVVMRHDIFCKNVRRYAWALDAQPRTSTASRLGAEYQVLAMPDPVGPGKRVSQGAARAFGEADDAGLAVRLDPQWEPSAVARGSFAAVDQFSDAVSYLTCFAHVGMRCGAPHPKHGGRLWPCVVVSVAGLPCIGIAAGLATPGQDATCSPDCVAPPVWQELANGVAAASSSSSSASAAASASPGVVSRRSVVVQFADQTALATVALASIQMSTATRTVSYECALKLLHEADGNVDKAMTAVLHEHMQGLKDKGIRLMAEATGRFETIKEAILLSFHTGIPVSQEFQVKKEAKHGDGAAMASSAKSEQSHHRLASKYSSVTEADQLARIAAGETRQDADMRELATSDGVGIRLHGHLSQAVRVMPLGWNSRQGLQFAKGLNRFSKLFHQVASGIAGKTARDVAALYFITRLTQTVNGIPNALLLQYVLTSPPVSPAGSRASSSPSSTGAGSPSDSELVVVSDSDDAPMAMYDEADQDEDGSAVKIVEPESASSPSAEMAQPQEEIAIKQELPESKRIKGISDGTILPTSTGTAVSSSSTAAPTSSAQSQIPGSASSMEALLRILPQPTEHSGSDLLLVEPEQMMKLAKSAFEGLEIMEQRARELTGQASKLPNASSSAENMAATMASSSIAMQQGAATQDPITATMSNGMGGPNATYDQPLATAPLLSVGAADNGSRVLSESDVQSSRDRDKPVRSGTQGAESPTKQSFKLALRRRQPHRKAHMLSAVEARKLPRSSHSAYSCCSRCGQTQGRVKMCAAARCGYTTCSKCFSASVSALKKPCKGSWETVIKSNWWLCFGCCPAIATDEQVNTSLSSVQELINFAVLCATRKPAERPATGLTDAEQELVSVGESIVASLRASSSSGGAGSRPSAITSMARTRRRRQERKPKEQLPLAPRRSRRPPVKYTGVDGPQPRAPKATKRPRNTPEDVSESQQGMPYQGHDSSTLADAGPQGGKASAWTSTTGQQARDMTGMGMPLSAHGTIDPRSAAAAGASSFLPQIPSIEAFFDPEEMQRNLQEIHIRVMRHPGLHGVSPDQLTRAAATQAWQSAQQRRQAFVDHHQKQAAHRARQEQYTRLMVEMQQQQQRQHQQQQRQQQQQQQRQQQQQQQRQQQQQHLLFQQISKAAALAGASPAAALAAWQNAVRSPYGTIPPPQQPQSQFQQPGRMVGGWYRPPLPAAGSHPVAPLIDGHAAMMPAPAAPGVAGAGASPTDAASFLDSVKAFYHDEPRTAEELVYMLQEFQNRRMGPETLVRNILSLIKRAPDSLVASLLSFVPAKLGHLIQAELERRKNMARMRLPAH